MLKIGNYKPLIKRDKSSSFEEFYNSLTEIRDKSFFILYERAGFK